MALTKVYNRLIAGAPVSVKDFGAIGDGVTDDTVAIQAGIDAVSVGGGTLYFPVGTYLVSSSLTINKTGVGIVGDGHGSRESGTAQHGTVIKWGGGLSNVFVYGDGGTTTVFACTVRDIAINCSDLASRGFYLNQKCSNFIFENTLVFDAVTSAWDLGTSSFANRWINCVAYGFGTIGWRLKDLCHNSTLIGCKAWGGSAKSPTYSVAIGETAACNQINLIGCDFETWNVTAQVLVYNGDGVNINGCYMEAKDASTLYQIQLGTTTAGQSVDGFSITGNRMIGNAAGAYAIRLVTASGGQIAGNFVSSFTTSVFLVTAGRCSNVNVGSNEFSSLTETNSWSGLGKLSGDELSFYTGTTPVAKQTVTGSKASNAALADLLTKLAALGLITDSTT